MILQIQQMLKESFKDKIIGILGYQTFTGQILLKKILQNLHKINKIIIIQIGKDNLRRNNISSYNHKQNNKIIYQSIEQLSYNKPSIDILFSLFQPIDFSNIQKVIQLHLLKTSKITSILNKLKINKIIHLSSIYLKQSGYISQQDQFDTTLLKNQFSSKQQAINYLKDNFNNQIQAWRWTIHFIQKTYAQITSNITILRVPSLGPTIINYEGYSTKFNYFTYLIYQIGTGLIKNIDGNRNNKIDIVPADYIANLLIVLAGQNNNNHSAINLSTSTRNYITLQQFAKYCQQAWQQYGNITPKVTITQNHWRRKIKRTKQLLPSQIKKRLGSILDIVSWKIQGNRANHQMQQKLNIINKYKYFLTQQWLCQSIKSIDIYNQLSPQDQNIFDFNINSINWKIYVKLCVYSIKKYLLNQNVEQFKPQTLDLLRLQSKPYFSDIMWALRQGKSAPGQTSKEAVNYVLNSKAVKQAIKMLVQQKMTKLEGPAISYQKAEQQMKKTAEQMCVQMFSDYSMGSIRMFAWFLHKVFGTIYQRVVIDKSGLNKLQNHNQKTQGPLIIIPTHRSYIDFLIMSYVFFGNKIKCPHIAAAQDFLNMAIIHILLRKSGAFFIKRNQKKYKELYKAIMNQYISKLLIGNHYLQFFIQGTRSRTGKMLAPKFGMLSLVASNVAQGRIVDAHILPVTINYQRVLQGNSFTYEMMGQAKVKQSLSRLLKAADVLKQNYGRIYLELCETISVKQWLNTQNGTFPQKIQKLGNKIVTSLTNNLIITGPAIISSVVLMNRKGISDDSLQQKTSWLSKQISQRGIKITRSQADSSISVNSTLSLLQGILQKSKKDMFQVNVSFDQNSFVKLFTLTYYRNTLTHIFFQQAIIATALSAFGHQKIINDSLVNLDDLYTQTCFLSSLLENQYYLPNSSLSDKKRYHQILSILSAKNLIKISNNNISALNLSGNYYNFYWSLIWPIIDAYWITCLYLFKLLKNNIAIPTTKFLSEIQWFGQSLLNQRIINHLESISSDTIKNAVAIFQKMKLIKNIKQQLKGQQVTLIKINADEPTLKNTLQKVQSFSKNYYAKSLKGILESTQGSVNIDFPFLSKL